MNRKEKLFLVFASLFVLSMNKGCSPGCSECDPDGVMCFACDADKETDVFGGCHDNTIDKCTIYGPTGECFQCQPTFTLKDGGCVKDYRGCMNDANFNECL